MRFSPSFLCNVGVKYPIDNFNISLYGVTEQSFKKITRSKANPKKVLQNIFILAENKIDFMLRTPVSIDVLPVLSELSDFCNSIGVKYKIDPKIFWKQNGERVDNLRIHSNDVKKYLGKHPVYESLYNSMVNKYEKVFIVKTCRWGINEFYINPYGKMHYCNVYWNTMFDLRKESFSDIWNKKIKNMRKIEGDFCIGKVAAGTDRNCPSGLFYYDKNINTSLGIRERLAFKSLGSKEDGSIIQLPS